MRNIGFCHGVTFKFLDPYSKENIDTFLKSGCTTIEINCHSVSEIDKLESIKGYLCDFKYKSIHLPGNLRYKDDELTNSVLTKIGDYYHKIEARLAVVHPDLIDDVAVFYKYPHVNWAIENMDDRKAKYKSVSDLIEFFNVNNDWGFVLDVGHCNANDKTMKLASDFITEFKDRIKEIHLSGYQVFHDPLFRTKQIEIIDYCKNFEVPIIIESILEAQDGLDGVKSEFEFIANRLSS